MNSFSAKKSFSSGGSTYQIYSLMALANAGHNINRLPYSLRVLLENLLRTEDNKSVFAEDIVALANWDAKAEPSKEISFTPARVILQDFTGVPCVVDLAAMREAKTIPLLLSTPPFFRMALSCTYPRGGRSRNQFIWCLSRLPRNRVRLPNRAT